MFSELYEKGNIFRKKYMENLINRFTNASLGVEGVDGDLADTIQAMNIYQQTQALEYAFSIDKNERLNTSIVKEIEDILTGGEIVDFRKTRAEVVGSNVPRSKPQFIYMDLYTLFDNYYNIWKDLDPFLREAHFHIRFLHIHPFEDGNGRTARILLIRNLCSNNQVPCVITKEVKSEYCSYIENNDPEGLAEFMRKIADKELNTILNLYRSLDAKGLIKENIMTDGQKKQYEKIVKNIQEENIGNDDNQKIEEEQKYPLRNLENLISLFKYNSLPKVSSDEVFITKELYRYDHILDKDSGDAAVYSEENRNMTINLADDDRFFKIYQNMNKLCFEIDGEKVLPQEFEYELSNEEFKEKKEGKRK